MSTWECPACLGRWPEEEQGCPWCRWAQQVERSAGQTLAVLL